MRCTWNQENRISITYFSFTFNQPHYSTMIRLNVFSVFHSRSSQRKIPNITFTLHPYYPMHENQSKSNQTSIEHRPPPPKKTLNNPIRIAFYSHKTSTDHKIYKKNAIKIYKSMAWNIMHNIVFERDDIYIYKFWKFEYGFSLKFVFHNIINKNGMSFGAHFHVAIISFLFVFVVVVLALWLGIHTANMQGYRSLQMQKILSTETLQHIPYSFRIESLRARIPRYSVAMQAAGGGFASSYNSKR